MIFIWINLIASIKSLDSAVHKAGKIGSVSVIIELADKIVTLTTMSVPHELTLTTMPCIRS